MYSSLCTLCAHRQGQIGFLRTSNRINVMLSRAKHGMYILGHVDTLTANKKSTMWREVRCAFKPQLDLRHPDVLPSIIINTVMELSYAQPCCDLARCCFQKISVPNSLWECISKMHSLAFTKQVSLTATGLTLLCLPGIGNAGSRQCSRPRVASHLCKPSRVCEQNQRGKGL